MRFSQICNTRVNPIMIGNQGFSILLQFCRLFVHFLQILYLVKFFDKVLQSSADLVCNQIYLLYIYKHVEI